MQLNCLITEILYSVPFLSIFIILLLILSIFLLFSFISSIGFTILSEIFFPMNSPVAAASLCATFLVTVFRASSHVLLAVCTNCFPYLLARLLPNDKNPYPFGIFSHSWFYRIVRLPYLLISNTKLTLSSISNSLPLISFKNTKLLGSIFNR